MYLKEYDTAIECFNQANSLQRHDATYMVWVKMNAFPYTDCGRVNQQQIGKVHTLRENFQAAVDVYTEALELAFCWYRRLCSVHFALTSFMRTLRFSPENADILTTLGLLYLKLDQNVRAFDFLGMRAKRWIRYVDVWMYVLCRKCTNSKSHKSEGLLCGCEVVLCGAYGILATNTSVIQTILAAGSIIQGYGDVNVALVKYRTCVYAFLQ